MKTIYLDHNYVSDVAGTTRIASAEDERARAQTMARSDDFRFTVSVWNIYEVARAGLEQTREGCIQYIETLNPLYSSNPRLVQRQELLTYLLKQGHELPYRNETPCPFCETVARMWATYPSATPFVDEDFRMAVRMLQDKKNTDAIDTALADGPKAAQAGRDALKQGFIEANAEIIDREWLLALLPERDEAGNFVTKQTREELVGWLTKDMAAVYVACPAIHAEEQLVRHRIASDRKLKVSDGVDTQFLILAVAYCDYLVTADGALREAFREVAGKIGAPCKLLSGLAEL
ncbi:hypothetical protein ACNRBV_03990 [Ralstonia pseudosolanacearum]|uniref:hypothetical protein n=1 Tax=Ralstonia pseudosolanacearum TaxID=1310165 RepID=UPI0018A44FF8|nr:hypothetical protein [Ralstonia pseudosolanacearum]BCL93362.1 hypothetical protein MAFF211479_30630 [Ralstonia solanacearum]BCN05929.1 hypothetical protein RPSB_30660 [Ralstonia solanacearum]